MSAQPKTVMLSPFAPFEGIAHAGGLYVLEYARAVASLGGRVTVISPPLPQGVLAAEESFERVTFETKHLGAGFVGRAYRYGHSLLRALTPGAGVLRGVQSQSAILGRLAEADIVDVHYSHYLPLVRLARQLNPNAVLIAHEHDVHAVAVRRARSARQFRERNRARLVHRRVRRLEVTYLNEFDFVLTLKPSDADLLTDWGVTARVIPFEPYVAVPATVTSHDGCTVLMVGAFDRPENLEGAKWLLDQVWPRVVAEVPGARLILAGSSPPSGLAGSQPRVYATGYVPDLNEWYSRADVAVAPIFRGAGIKVKVPQAMAFGLPVVATTIAAEGIALNGETPAPIDVVDDPLEFAAAIIRLLGDRERRATQGQLARSWVLQRFDFGQRVRNLIEQSVAPTIRSRSGGVSW